MTGETLRPQYVPVYCLSQLSAAERAAYNRAINSNVENGFDWVFPKFIPRQEDGDGDLAALQRKWLTTGGRRFDSHFAFFIDRKGVNDTSIIVAQRDVYTMLYSTDAEKYAGTQLALHINAKNDGRTHFPEVKRQTIECLNDNDLHDFLRRGLNFGRVPAWDLRDIWANLDIANMSMSELLTYHGGTVGTIKDEQWNEQAFLEKLERFVYGKVSNETVWVPLNRRITRDGIRESQDNSEKRSEMYSGLSPEVR